MDAPSANHPQRGSLPWLVSGWALIAAVAVLVCGIVKIFSFHPTAWVTGIYAIVLALVMVLLEGPRLLSRVHPILERINTGVSSLKYWHKGVLYTLLSLVFFISLSITTIIALVLVLSVAAAYFFLQVGTRANRAQEMEDAIYRHFDDRQRILSSSSINAGASAPPPSAPGQSAGV